MPRLDAARPGLSSAPATTGATSPDSQTGSFRARNCVFVLLIALAIVFAGAAQFGGWNGLLGWIRGDIYRVSCGACLLGTSVGCPVPAGGDVRCGTNCYCTGPAPTGLCLEL